MKLFAAIFALGLIAGCTSTTPHYDAKFGDAVRAARVAMTINPDAGKGSDSVTGMDGASARNTVLQYQGTFAAPPPVTNVSTTDGAGSHAR